jgi:ubiquinone/menaquinone biosynthesis C-methylase UbiE
LAEFTGERVIPGEVDVDLWNEHFARYAFAARLARGRRVLDIACGTGYGSAELAAVARSVTGIDISPEAVEYAAARFQASNLSFQPASAVDLPFEDHSFDLIVAFEVIEHLTDYRALLSEARRLLTPGGQFIVSTPNRLYYEESRRQSGPNPFHTHEFEFQEFRDQLADFFPHVSFFLQNHSDTIVFQPLDQRSSTEVRTEPSRSNAPDSHFFVAVCAMSPQTGTPTFVYIPAIANVLKERERHIALLESELRTKTEWLDRAVKEHDELVKQHRAQTAELEQRNRWADQLNKDLQQAGERVVQLQDELSAEQKAARESIELYESKISEMDADIRAKTQWALDTEKRLTAEIAAKCEELAKCVEVLHETEGTLEERTRWALSLQQQIEQLHVQLGSVTASRWYRMGRTLGLGPELRTS